MSEGTVAKFMKRSAVGFILAAAFPTWCLPLHAGVTTYPDPPNAVTSTVFTVTVDGTPVTVMKYMDYHYAHFAFDGRVSVKVTTSQPVTSYRISPSSLGLQGEVSGTNLTFSMDQVAGADATPRYLVLQINALEKLVLLGDPPETNVPPSTGEGIFNVVSGYGADPTGVSYTQPAIQNAINAASNYGTASQPGIVYVPPGIYKVRANLLLRNNVDLYLAPGAVLKADDNIANYTISGGTLPPVLTVNNAENVTIRGRGEVDASGVALMNLFSRTPPIFVTQSTQHPRRRIIRTNNGGTSRNVVIDGVVCKDASGWSVELKRTLGVRAQNVKVLNHKNINWKIENDGINVCSSSDALVNQCFVMTIDDAGCAKATDAVMGSMDRVRFSNNVVWTWSAGVKCGMQNDHPMNEVVFENIDIIHCRRAIALDTKTSQDLGRSIPIEGVLFDRIRVDEIEGHWNIANHDAVEFLLEDAEVNNVTIRNLALPKNRPLRCGPNYRASNVTFVNLVMNSQLITNVSQVTLGGSRQINGLVFQTAGPAAVLNGPPTHSETIFEITAAFSEPVSGLSLDDFAVTNATVSTLSGGPSTYALTITPDAPGWVSVHLPADAVRNSAGVGNFASNSLNIPRAARPISLPEVGSGTLYLHLKADDLALADGAAVTSWTDSTGNFPFTGTATFDADYANGHAGVRFNGESDVLGNTNLTGAPNVGRATLFLVAGFPTAGNDGVSDFLISGQYPSGTSNNRFRIFKRANDGRVDARVGSGSTIAGVVANPNVHIIGLISGQTPGTVNLLMDGKIVGSGTSGSVEPLQALFLGAYGNTPDQFFDGTIAEVLLFDGALTTADAMRIQDYLTRKYFGHALDTDVDGLPDVWEMTRFGNLSSSSGGSNDFDHDRFTDVDEWITGTDPTDARSFFNATIGKLRPDSLEVSFEANPERRYVLQTSTDLVHWTESGSVGSLPASGLQTLLLETPTDDPARFIRIGVSLE